MQPVVTSSKQLRHADPDKLSIPVDDEIEVGNRDGLGPVAMVDHALEGCDFGPVQEILRNWLRLRELGHLKS